MLLKRMSPKGLLLSFFFPLSSSSLPSLDQHSFSSSPFLSSLFICRDSKVSCLKGSEELSWGSPYNSSFSSFPLTLFSRFFGRVPRNSIQEGMFIKFYTRRSSTSSRCRLTRYLHISRVIHAQASLPERDVIPFYGESLSRRLAFPFFTRDNPGTKIRSRLNWKKLSVWSFREKINEKKEKKRKEIQ